MYKGTIIYVLNRKGKPICPTRRSGHVRKLLKSGKAVVVNTKPFTIRLKYDVDFNEETLTLGFDPGRQNIGLGASDENGDCVYLANVTTNNRDVHSNMVERRQYRQGRRHNKRKKKQRKALRDGNEMKTGKDDTFGGKPCKSKKVKFPGAEEPVTAKVIKPAEAQFNNRKRPDGWLTPSGQALVEASVNAVKLAMETLPVKKIAIERNSFDFQLMQNQNIRSWQYSKGPLYGFKSYKDYIYAQQHGKCLLCGNEIDHYHHIIPRSEGGTDTIHNIAGLCEDCHTLVHNDSGMKERLLEARDDEARNFKVSLLNSTMPAIIEAITAIGIEVEVTDGQTTKATRDKYGIDKDHCLDGYAISLAGREVKSIRISSEKYNIQHFKKKSNNVISARGCREYYFNGKLVAKNRHKAMNQKVPSLEEYMVEYALTHDEKDCARHFHELEIHPAKRVYTFHKDKVRQPFHVGDTIRYEKYNKTYGNTKTATFVAVGVEVKEGKVNHGDGNKTKKVKFCRFLKGGSLDYV